MTENVTWSAGIVSRKQRSIVTGGRGMTIWLTGLSGSGKSAVAVEVEERLVKAGVAAYLLDGDNTRHGLNSDLGFSAEERRENVRRLGEVALLMADAGLVALVSAISPYRVGREAVRRAHQAAGVPFGEVHVATPLEECERRDPKGLYAKARAGEIASFTGVDDPYEEPRQPDVRIGDGEPLGESVERVMTLIGRFAESQPD